MTAIYRGKVADIRVAHCYGQTPEVAKALAKAFTMFYDEGIGEKPEYDRYEEGRDWQPTVCGLRAPDADVVRPSDFVATVNHTDPDVDMDALDGTGYEALPFQDGDFIPDAEPCGSCKVAAPLSWPFLFYASDKDDGEVDNG